MGDNYGGRWTSATDLPVRRWVLLTGGRLKLVGVLSGGLALLTFGLVWGDVIYVGDGSTFATVLASGAFGALATVVTVTLSINQLVLSRVFGTPGNLHDRLEGNLEFRRSVEAIADVDASPNDPGNFLALVADTLERQAASLERRATVAENLDQDATDDVLEFTSRVVSYADRLGTARGSESTFEVLSLTFGTEYADLMDDARALERRVESTLPETAEDDLASILELLKAVAVVRQFFKTLAVQQDLARLSRWLIYTGVPALLLTYFLAQVYTPMGPTIPAAWLPWVAVVVTPIIFSPVTVLVVSLLRVATVTLYTVSVGSFIPPEERVGGS